MATRNLSICWENLTKLEQVVYICFTVSGDLYDNFDAATYNAACGTWVDVELWAWSSALSMNQIKGVIASLVKKSLIIISHCDKEGNWLSFTEAGYNLLKHVVA